MQVEALLTLQVEEEVELVDIEILMLLKQPVVEDQLKLP